MQVQSACQYFSICFHQITIFGNDSGPGKIFVVGLPIVPITPDGPSVSRLFLFLITALLAAAQSHPGWWTFVAPDAKSLVGIEWAKLAGSPFEDALRGELSSGGSLGFPDLPCLAASRDFLISSPPLLAAASGGCTAALLRDQATSTAMKSIVYRGFTIWLPAANGLGAAQFGDQVALIGSRKSIEAAIDRSIRSSDPADRRYSPLLIAGARLARTRDLWVVAAELPDPLASLFVPLSITARNFEGGITAHDSLDQGLQMGAIHEAASDKGAAEAAASIRNSIPTLPAVAKGLEVAANGSSVVLSLSVARAELLASLRQPEAPEPVEPVPDPKPRLIPIAAPAATPARVLQAVPEKPAPVAAPAAVLPAVPEKPAPQVIRIYGLDEGTREIVLPPKEPR